MKYLIPIMVILLLVSTSFVGVSYDIENSKNTSSNGKTLYVGGSGPGNYTKIQDAIDDASDGDTVFIYSGTYVENLIVHKSINLIGEDRESTIIDGNQAEDVVYFGTGADWVNITGFTIRNGTSGLWIVKSHCTISKNIIMNNQGRGISLLYAQGCNITYNTINNNGGAGICEHWGGYNNYLSNTFKNNTGDAISLYFLIGNNVFNNTINECQTGISLYEASNCLIVENIIKNSSYCGIGLSYSSCGNKINGNNITNSSIAAGILIGGFVGGISKYNIITNNTISSNNWSGILLEITTNQNIIEGNTVFNNENFGVAIWNSDNNHVTGNAVFSNALGGVYLIENSNYNNISGNNIYDNIYYGGIFLMEVSNNNLIHLNHITNNTIGINISESSNNKIINNNFINNRNVLFSSCRNQWHGNFWSKPLMLPKLIFGKYVIGPFVIPWVNFDWHPAKEPYDIGV